MKYGVIAMPREDAKKYVAALGSLDTPSIQFEDQNTTNLNRPYRAYTQRLDECDRLLRYLTDQITKTEGLAMETGGLEEFLKTDPQYDLNEVESELKNQANQFQLLQDNNATLVTDRNSAQEESYVVKKAMEIFGGMKPQGGSLSEPMLGSSQNLQAIAGVVPKADEGRFTRALYRVSRGKLLQNTWDIEDKIFDPKTGTDVDKCGFMIYFQGQGDESVLASKMEKVCQVFGVSRYEWPANLQAAEARAKLLQGMVQDRQKVVEAKQAFINQQLGELLAPVRPGANSKIEEYRLFCIRERSLYTALNMCEEKGQTLTASVWYPSAEEQNIKEALRRGGAQAAVLEEGKVGKKDMPPTYIRVNDFTEGWQDVVNTYGVPLYKEANPALLTVVTFPFIFGMMYGDVGHGSMLLLTGIFLCMQNESFKFSQPGAWGARYMVVQMGIFAVFAGFMYNDFVSLGLPIFATRWQDDDGNGVLELKPDAEATGPYPFGIDWSWHGANNELLFMNSLKMKLSVLMGVIQMGVGVLLRFSNACYFRQGKEFLCECIPMIIFLCCFFGWMDFLIIYKWTHRIPNPPSIINSLIKMAMFQPTKPGDPIFWEASSDTAKDSSAETASNLMLATVAVVPVMLFVKPLWLWAEHKCCSGRKHGAKAVAAEDAEAGLLGEEEEEEFEMGEIFIHQIIEVIEYVLGTVSHTASYLRIWALSLAHQQLSLVFFQKTIQMGLTMAFPWNGIALYFLYGAWFLITLMVLLGMDVLECFLHTLRLHWVEFQSKFYNVGGSGSKFAPFSISQVLLTAE